MANRFSTLPQYHTLIKAHGTIGAIVFLFIIPAAIFYARFYTRRPGSAIRYHAYLQILAVLLTTVVFTLGWFAVGPERSLTNPHHGIGVAIYTLILIQIFGGWIIKNIRGRSLRVMLHQWFGRTVALLGMAQVPLGLALYGSPKYLFILYALWMAFLLLMYFIFDYRAWDRPDYVISDRDRRSEVTRTERTERSGRRSSRGASRWLGPAAAAGGLWALMRGRKERSPSRERSRSRSRVSRVRSRSRAPEVIPSRRESYIEEKHTERYSERPRPSSSGGGLKDRFLALGAGLGAGALIARMTGRRSRTEDEEYSAVATDTPGRRRRSRSGRRHGGTVVTDYSDESEEYRRDGRRSPLLPGPGGPSAMAAAISAAERRPSVSRPVRPQTPRRSHHRGDSRVDSTLDSDYSSYVSPSRRGSEAHHSKGNVEKGLLAGLGLGWFAKKMKDRRESKQDDRLREEEERLRIEEDERRAGQHEPRYTGDGYGHNTPPRRHSRRQSLRPAAPIRTGTEATQMTEEESSLIEPRPLSGYDAPRPNLSTEDYQQYHPPPPGPVPPPMGQYTSQTAVAPTPPPSLPVPPADHVSHSRTHSTHSFVEPAVMPVIPDDPRGILARSSESDSYVSQGDRRRSESRRRAGEAAMVAAASSAGMLAAEQEAQRRVEEERGASRGRTPPVSVKVKVHDDKDRNVTLRRLTEEEAMAARRARRRRADSASSLSGSDVASGSRSRYRRDSSRRRAAEEGAESVVAPLSPPQPSFAGGKRPKDSAYYSGPPPVPGPSGTHAGAGATVSSLGHSGSHGTWSGMSPVGTPGVPGPSEAASATASAADRRRRRRLERRNDRPAASGTVDFT